MAESTRACRKCDRTLALSEYYRDARSPGGFRTACKACHIADVLRRQSENAATYAAYQAEYRAARRDKARQTTAKYRAENPDQVRASQQRYRSDPINQEIARERAKAFRLANPDLRSEYERRRRAAKTSRVVGFVTPQLLAAKISYWAERCWICSAPWEQIDHVKPLSKGGLHMLANLRPICADCNLRKASRWPFSPTAP